MPDLKGLWKLGGGRLIQDIRNVAVRTQNWLMLLRKIRTDETVVKESQE
jgi:hypothetical protein